MLVSHQPILSTSISSALSPPHIVRFLFNGTCMVLVQYCGMALILKTVLLSFIQTVTVLLSIVPVLYVCSALNIMNNFLWLAKQMVHSVELNLLCCHSVFDSALYNRESSLKNCSILFLLSMSLAYEWWVVQSPFFCTSLSVSSLSI